MKNILRYLFIALLIWQYGCQSHSHDTENHSHDAADHQMAESGNIHLTTAQLATAGIEYGSFVQKNLGTGLSVNAELAVHPEHMATVSAYSDGIISEIKTSLNAAVRKGQVLAVVRKPELLDMQQDFLENKARLEFLQTEYDRYASLKNADATAMKNFQKAESELRLAWTHGQVLAAKLRQFQIDPDQLSADNLRTTLSLLAPVGGVVTNVFSNTGAAVQAGTPVCQVTDLSQLHAELWVFEKDLSAVKTGQKVRLNFPADRSHHFSAVIYSIDKQFDPQKRAVRAHARLEGNVSRQGNFVNGAFLEATIETGKANSTTALPEEAVVREAEADFIFIVEKETQEETNFRKVPVRRGPAEDGLVVVQALENIPAEAKIVVKGTYYVSAKGTSIDAEHEH